jgi:3-dehydroquinate dehydratase-1
MTTSAKPIEVRGRRLSAQDHPIVCTPLTGRSLNALRAELATIIPKAPDLLEWRLDFFNDIADTGLVLAAAALVRDLAGSVPVILTRRSIQEGGEPIPLDENQVVELLAVLCASGHIDLVDYELCQPQQHRRRMRAVSQAHGVALIASYHDFHRTPSTAAMLDILVRAERDGADVAKLAVMPQVPGDVLHLLEAGLLASTVLRIPLITMSMGALGAISRVCGVRYGSSVTFAAGARASAPGQMSIEALRAAMAALDGARPFLGHG